MSVTAELGSTNRRSNRARWIALAVVLAVGAFVLVLATRPAANTEIPASPLVGQAAPPVVGTALDGRSVDLATYRGRFVVVNFFATWCIPCQQEHPELKKFSETHQGANSPAVIAVAYDQNDISNARSWFAQKGGTWPVVANDGGHIAVSYGVRGLPESYVVDPNGNIAAHLTGAVTAAQLETLTGGIA